MSSTPPVIVIRRAETSADYQACQAAQRRAWGITADGYVVPVATMVGAQLHGGLVLGAFLPSGEAAGLSFAFLGRSEGRLCLYSQLTGVVPEYQGQGIGRRLKEAQWEYARLEGLELLAWAFDPLQAGNAAFNLDVLGAVGCRYIMDMYGPRSDLLNANTPTDRLIVEWTTAPVVRVPREDKEAAALPRIFQVDTRADGWPEVIAADLHLAAPVLLLEIPAHFNRLRQVDLALGEAWRLAVRTGMLTYLAAGYRVTGFMRGERPCYRLER